MRQNVHEKEQSQINWDEEEEETMMISLNIKEIENMFTMEEETYVLHMHNQFNKTSQGISLGEKFTNETVQFCQVRIPIFKEFLLAMHMANK